MWLLFGSVKSWKGCLIHQKFWSIISIFGFVFNKTFPNRINSYKILVMYERPILWMLHDTGSCPSFELATNWLLEVLQNPQKLPPSICQSKNVTFWACTLHLTFLDWQIDGSDFWGSQKHFQESVGGQFKTCWGHHHDFVDRTQKVTPLLLGCWD